MKKIYILPLILLFSSILSGQTPEAFKYQAMIRDSASNLLSDVEISLKISLIEGTIQGDPKYEETHLVTTTQFGLININIGMGTVLTGSMSDIKWGDSTYFIKTEVDLSGGNDFEFMGVSQILSVPVAIYASRSGDTTRWRKDSTNLYYEQGSIGVGTYTPRSLLHLSKSTSQSPGYPGITISNPDSSGNSWFMGIDAGFDPEGFSIVSDSSLSAPALFISKDGKIGVGKDEPEYAMDIQGSIYTSEGIWFPDSTFVVSAESFWGISENCIFKDTGNVVIGNSGCSQYRLQIEPTTEGKGLLIDNITSINESGIASIEYPGGVVRQLGLINPSSDTTYGYGIQLLHNEFADTLNKWAGIYVDFAFPDSNKYAAIFKSGNVGIGTDFPDQKLHVEGNSIFNGNIGINNPNPEYSMDIYGDLRIKDNLVGDTLSTADKFLIKASLHDFATRIEMGKGSDSIGRNIKLITRENGQIQFFTNSKIRMQVRDSVVVLGKPEVDKYVDLNVNGKIQAQEVEVYIGDWWDNVFDPGYALPPLEEVELFITENNHLPDIPSEQEIMEDGVNLGEMDGLLLKKIEELTLYMIELKKENTQLALEIEKLKLKDTQVR